MSRGHDPQAISAAAQRRAAAPDRSAWVAASAGTGKTKVLVDRLLNLLLAGTRPQRILCLTFTKAAAQEMALRLSGILRDWTTKPDLDLAARLRDLTGAVPDDETTQRARRLFAEVLDTPGGLRIDTIHAFCQSLLRRFPLEARLPPNFQVLDERSATELLQDSVDAVLAAARQDENGDLARALAAVSARVSENSFDGLIAELIRERGRLKRLIEARGGVRRAIERLYRRLGLKPDDTPETLVTSACRDAEIDLAGLRRSAQALSNGGKSDGPRGKLLADWLADAERRVATFDKYLELYFTKTDGKRRGRLVTREVLLAAPGIDEVLAAELVRLEQVVARCNAARNAAGTAALLRLGAAIEARYAAAKIDRAVLDYDDLILETRNLLKRPGIAPWVLYKLDGGLDHVLIDEAQDTNPEQWEVIEALAGEFFAGDTGRLAARTVFAVGDVKQSIYSFQRAEPKAFVRLRNSFETQARGAGRPWQNEELVVSFRSTSPVLAAVDAVFARPVAADGVALDGSAIRHETVRGGDAGLVEVWPPVVPRERITPAAWEPPVERYEEDSPPARLARLIAQKVASWIGKEPLESKGRLIHAGDIMILVRRRNALVDLMVRELKKAGVEVAGIDRMVLADQLAIMDLIALGRFLLLPDDDLTLATVLKGPLFGFTEEQLFSLAHGRERRLWQELRARKNENDAFAAAERELAELLARVDFVRPYDLFAEVLGPRGGRRRIVARLGAEANDPLDEFLAACLAFERGHPPALETFLHWLEAGREEIKRDLESPERREVRVMTVHGAKGLQAPIVILPDTMQVPRTGPRLLWLSGAAEEPDTLLWSPETRRDDAAAAGARTSFNEAQRAEYRRLLYVAMTRAEDRLYVCGYEDRKSPPEGCWYELIRTGLAAAEGIERFTMSGDASGEGLRLRSPQLRAIERPRPQPVATDAKLPEWWQKPPPAEADPPQPLVPSRPEGEEPPVRGPFEADDTLRFRRGRVIHRLLQTLPDLLPEERDAAARRFLARAAHRLDATAQDEIRRETLEVMARREWAELFGPGSVAEAPVVGRIGTRVLSGQIDRLVVTAGEVRIIDYKTNRPPPLKPDEVPPMYLAQMAAYRATLAAVYPGWQVRCALLWTDGPKLMELPDELLDRHAP